MSLAKKTVNGLKWTTASTILTSLLQLIYISIMAYQLEPEDFGWVTLSGVVVLFGGYFTRMGLGQAIIQKEDLSRSDVRAVFTSSVFLGLACYTIVYFGAPFASYLLKKNPEIFVPIIQLQGLGLFAAALAVPAINIMRRRMRFRDLSIISFISFVIGYLGVGVFLAFSNYGLWSLVYARLTQIFINFILNYVMIRHNLIPIFQWKYYRPLMAYGSKMTLNNLLEFFYNQMNNILIGRFLGPAPLGIYDRAQQLVYLPSHSIISNIYKVMFPAFSRLQSNLEKLREAYLTTITLIALLLFPITIGMSVASREIVLVVLGAKFEESIVLLSIISPAIAMMFVTYFAGVICDAIDRIKSKIFVNMYMIVLFVGIFLALKQYGLIGFAIAVVIGELLRTIFYIRLMIRFLKVGLSDYISVYISGIGTGLWVGLAIFGTAKLMYFLGAPIQVVLIAEIIAGGISLGVKSIFFPHRILKEKIIQFSEKMNLDKIRNRWVRKMYLSYMNYIQAETSQAKA